MTRTPQETAQAIAEYEQMFGKLSYLLSIEQVNPDAYNALGLTAIDSEAALILVSNEYATESLIDEQGDPFVCVELLKG